MNLRCAVCHEGVIKYKCPRCLIQTCCLACVKQHKQRTKCSGIRDKTAFVKKTSFTDMHLLSDYRFLEDAARKSDSANRDTLKRRSERPWHVNKLIHQARIRGVQLRILPYPSTKRKQNKTYFNNRTKAFSWHIEWDFPELSVTHACKVAEETLLESAMLELLESTQISPASKHRLTPYMREGSLRFLVKAEGRRADCPRYHALDPRKSIKSNLAGKVIVEYPTILVLDKNQCDTSYQLLDPDDDGVEILPKTISCKSESSFAKCREPVLARSKEPALAGHDSNRSFAEIVPEPTELGACTDFTHRALPITDNGLQQMASCHEASSSESTSSL